MAIRNRLKKVVSKESKESTVLQIPDKETETVVDEQEEHETNELSNELYTHEKEEVSNELPVQPNYFDFLGGISGPKKEDIDLYRVNITKKQYIYDVLVESFKKELEEESDFYKEVLKKVSNSELYSNTFQTEDNKNEGATEAQNPDTITNLQGVDVFVSLYTSEMVYKEKEDMYSNDFNSDIVESSGKTKELYVQRLTKRHSLYSNNFNTESKNDRVVSVDTVLGDIVNEEIVPTQPSIEIYRHKLKYLEYNELYIRIEEKEELRLVKKEELPLRKKVEEVEEELYVAFDLYKVQLSMKTTTDLYNEELTKTTEYRNVETETDEKEKQEVFVESDTKEDYHDTVQGMYKVPVTNVPNNELYRVVVLGKMVKMYLCEDYKKVYEINKQAKKYGELHYYPPIKRITQEQTKKTPVVDVYKDITTQQVVTKQKPDDKQTSKDNINYYRGMPLVEFLTENDIREVSEVRKYYSKAEIEISEKHNLILIKRGKILI